MCCLFGIIDYGHSFSGREKARLLHILGTQCEARGTDATGIAYTEGMHLRVYKRPVPAHKLPFRLSNDVTTIMGHTRMTTQGSETKNYNNHPFAGCAGSHRFALAHNGVLYNDQSLQKRLKLPKTNIETDSFVAVQLLEQKRALNFASLKYMAEEVEGSFTFTVLGEDNSIYFVKGDNPLCLIHYPKSGFYLYASTEEILGKALKRMRLACEKPVKMEVRCGDILKIDATGRVTKGTFDTTMLYSWHMPAYHYYRPKVTVSVGINDYLEELKSVVGAFGYDPEYIDYLHAHGMEPEEIEEYLYQGEL